MHLFTQPMRFYPKILAFVAGSVISGAAFGAVVANGSFEQPTTGNFTYIAGAGQPSTVTNNSWVWTDNGLPAGGGQGGGSGVAILGSPWDNTQPIPAGAQVAFVQAGGTSISQDVTLAAGSYTLNYTIAGRGDSGGISSYNVLFNSAIIDSGSTTTGSAYTDKTAPIVVPTGGTYTLKFLNTSPNGVDAAFVIDKVDIVPEPTSMTVLGAGTVSLLMARRKRTA